MKRILALLVLSFSLSGLSAQTLRVRDFSEATDSLQQRMKRRTGVENPFRLEKLQARGSVLDFYFSQNLAGYPWREGDVSWFTTQLSQLSVKILGNYRVGTIYAKRQKLTELVLPVIGNDGKPVPTRFRVKDPKNDVGALVRGDNEWSMGLSGRHLALWQSHGRYWEQTTDRWEWQRSATHSTLEDIYTQSYVLPFLIPMLENAGAVVLTPRERDPQSWEVVCDNDPAFAGSRPAGMRREGSYSEDGFWRDAGPGFADAKAAYSGKDNPFRMGTSRMTETSASAQAGHAHAIWRPDIPQKGYYAVYVSYRTLPKSTVDARYTVHHMGGETLLHVNQQMGGGMWVYLGTFLFDKGTAGYVSLSNHSSSPGVVTADAVRFGGGMGKIERGGSTSGLPAYVEGAAYSFQYGGMDMELLDKWEDDYRKDLTSRGTWVNELSGGSAVNPTAESGRRIPLDLALAFHSDAGVTPNDSIVGTLGIYTLRCENSEELPSGESRLTNRLFADFVQTQLVSDIRAAFEPDWTRRETRDRSYSECRVPQVPSMILEVLSHQNFADMRYGLDPSFRFQVSRAVYKGILKYLSARYGCPYAVQPLPVHAFSAREEDGRAILSWEPTRDSLEITATPSYYKVYTRRDDGAFNKGFQIQEPGCILALEPGHVYSFRITACNEGGESFPSEILAVGLPLAEGAKKVTVVNNFTRLSAPAWFDTPQYAGFTDRLDSGVPWNEDLLFAGSVNQFDRSREWTDDDNPGFGGSYTDMAGSRLAGNSFDFVAAHGRAILDAGYAFDSMSAEAFDGQCDAWALDLICGKQVTTRIGRGAVPNRYSVFPEALQVALRSYTAGGGNVLLSGAYIGTDAWAGIYPGVPVATESTRSFIQEVLGYKWVTNFGDVSGFVSPYGGASLPMSSYNRAWSPLTYRVENPDGIEPASGKARAIMRYNGTCITAATLFNADNYRVAAFGFPLETSPQMADIIKNVLRIFEAR